MHTFASVIDDLGGPSIFGVGIGVPDSHARAMKARGSIPSRYWPSVVVLAEKQSQQHITFELLANLAEQRANAPRETISLVPEQVNESEPIR